MKAMSNGGGSVTRGSTQMINALQSGSSQIGVYGQHIINTVPLLMKQAHAPSGLSLNDMSTPHVIDENSMLIRKS